MFKKKGCKVVRFKKRVRVYDLAFWFTLLLFSLTVQRMRHDFKRILSNSSSDECTVTSMNLHHSTLAEMAQITLKLMYMHMKTGLKTK